MGVQVHRQVEPLAQRRDQRPGGRRAQQPGHVLDRQDVRAGLDDPLGQAQVVVERVEPLAGVGQVAGVAERHLGDRRAGRADRLDGRPHLADVVERVEDAEDVDAGRRRLLDERLRHRGRVGRVADRVAAAQQHLQADVRHGRAQLGQPLPRVLGQEAQRHVVGRAAPGLERQQLAASSGRRGRRRCSRSRVRTRVASSDWCASRKVVSVTATGVWARSWRANPAGPERRAGAGATRRAAPGAGPPRAAC